MIQKSLFRSIAAEKPLAEDLKPGSMQEFVGQKHLFSQSRILTDILNKKKLPSLVLWGPPGTGKTSLSRILKAALSLPSFEIQATAFSTKDIKKLGDTARERFQSGGSRTLVFIDEIHRLNKAQQDTLLGYVEEGSFLLIGATTENPSFELNSALLSRVHVLCFQKHDKDSLAAIYIRGKNNGRIKVSLSEAALEALCSRADGDARFFLNQLEIIQDSHDKDEVLNLEELEELLTTRLAYHDKNRDQHYDLISAFHKALRASDTQGALYYLQRMLQGGEDRRFIIRRMIRFASEDIGLADPQALIQANAAREAFDFVGMPEGDLAIYQAVVYLASAPKSNAIYQAQKKTAELVQKTGQIPIPLHLRNPATKFMGEQGYGKNYQYDHDAPYHITGQNCLPHEITVEELYSPGELGFEKEIRKRLEFIEKIRLRRKN